MAHSQRGNDVDIPLYVGYQASCLQKVESGSGKLNPLYRIWTGVAPVLFHGRSDLADQDA